MEFVRRVVMCPDYTWEDLKLAAMDGYLNSIVVSGDYIPLVLKNGEDVGLDVGQDETGKTFFIFHKTLREYRPMYDRLTQGSVVYLDSNIRRWINEEVFNNLLPDDLKEVISPTSMRQEIDGVAHSFSDRLFLLSQTQVFGSGNQWCLEPEDSQIDIFRDPAYRRKVDTDDHLSYWWLRSASSASHFRLVTSGGSFGNRSAYSDYGVALGFCL